jgi:hypothetical protein
MIVKNTDGIIHLTNVTVAEEASFLAKNTTGGFIQVDQLPTSKYKNYKLVDGEIVVDTEKEEAAASLQYRLDRKYPPIEEQLDKLYHDMAADKGDKTGTWFAEVKSVKDATPKP